MDSGFVRQQDGFNSSQDTYTFKMKAFTLVELMSVVVIIGILAALVIPNFMRAVEKSRLAEAVALLGLIRAGQIRYRAQTGSFTDDLNDLKLNYDPPQFFQNESPCFGGSPASCPAPNIAQIQRNNVRNNFSQYWLFIDDDANIQCSDGGSGDCNWLI